MQQRGDRMKHSIQLKKPLKQIVIKGSLTTGLAFLVICCAAIQAQPLNPPYPRLGVFTFSGQTDAGIEILKDFDIIAFPPNDDNAIAFRNQNPNRVILATSGCLYAYGMTGIPEEWYYHDTAGERFLLWPGAYLMNITEFCPRVDIGDGDGPKTFIDHCLKDLEKIDFTIYDGVFHDWWWGGMGTAAKNTGDLNSNGVIDLDEMGIDSLRNLWQRALIRFHEREYQIPGLDYVTIQIGADWDIWPHVHGACFEDWPIYNGPWYRWRGRYTDSRTPTKEPKIMLHNGSISHFNNHFPTDPYKDNYRAVRFAFASCLFTRSFFYVDEGNQIGHHGNIHFYDEFEAKGMLGYPLAEMVQMTGKALAATDYAGGLWVRFFDNGVSVVNATGLPQTVTASELAALDPAGASQYYRFRGGQDPVFNSGQEVTEANPLVLWGDTKRANWPNDEVFGDGAMLFRSPVTLVTPVVVDNTPNNQTSPGSEPVQYEGTWVNSTDGELYYAYYTNRDYGPFQQDAFFWSPAGDGENVARYIPTIGVPGMYEVFEWHGYRGGSPGSYTLASNVPARIIYGGGQDTTVTVDQTGRFGQWNSLGTFYFDLGITGSVELSNDTDGIVISDAIQFVFKGSAEGYDTQAPAPPEGVEVIPLD